MSGGDGPRGTALNSRDEVLGRIRAATASAHADDVPRAYRLSGDLDDAVRYDLFEQRVRDYKAEVLRCPPDEIATGLAQLAQLAQRVQRARRVARVVVPPGLDRAWTSALPAEIVVDTQEAPLAVRALDEIGVVITASALAIAETGTIVLDSSPDQGRRAISLVPDIHLCVVTRVVQTVPEGIESLDPRRPLTFISGPSATSDIELDRVEGVHGPRTLKVLLVVAG